VCQTDVDGKVQLSDILQHAVGQQGSKQYTKPRKHSSAWQETFLHTLAMHKKWPPSPNTKPQTHKHTQTHTNKKDRTNYNRPHRSKRAAA